MRHTARVLGDVRFIAALLGVTIGAAVFAIAFRLSLGLWYRTASGAPHVVEALSSLAGWQRVAVLVIGATLAGLVRRWRVAMTQDASSVMEAVALGRVRLSLRTTSWRVVSSWNAIGSGSSIGREAP